ncbi:hypothetical protein BJY16_002487 [Actinoplanes octamycinicus]|uniref:Uncharacterized protein n=1 Tax=Actinoplanes octamycinicus TaxID=135948 RepID=A0A7W7GVH5_9ACTN|nr:hypothetical protein [Actinoplanes octamycinicus]MBB4739028.1 hypothetical protein [Actinoplanes octamycinicus]GIE60157.1 hypothetical protein Aoc01nite_55590 [Actinoplanes octamycinicus]
MLKADAAHLLAYGEGATARRRVAMGDAMCVEIVEILPSPGRTDLAGGELPPSGGKPPNVNKTVRATTSNKPGRRIVARYNSMCPVCRSAIMIGETIGRIDRTCARYGDPGWLCIPCQTASTAPAKLDIRHVVARIYLRWAAGKPVSLNAAEVEILAEEVLAADLNLQPERRCDAAEIESSGEHSSIAWRDWDQSEASIGEIVGYMLDGLHFDFSCNLRTATAFDLLAHIIESTCTCGDHIPPRLIPVYEVMRIANAWDALEWHHPLRREGKAVLAQRYPRSTLPALPLRPTMA